MMDDPSHLGLNYNRVDIEVRVKTFSNKQTVSLEDSVEYELTVSIDLHTYNTPTTYDV